MSVLVSFPMDFPLSSPIDCRDSKKRPSYGPEEQAFSVSVRAAGGQFAKVSSKRVRLERVNVPEMKACWDP